MKRMVVWLSIAVLCLLCVSTLSVSAEVLESERECSLTVYYAGDGQKLSGLSVSLYRVAEALPDGTFEKVPLFAAYPVSIHDVTTQSGWKQMADTLMGYVAADGVAPTATAVTAEDGVAAFAGLPTGLYLVGGVAARTEEAVWSFDNQMLYLPVHQGGAYVYDVTASPKGSATEPPLEGTEYRVLKLWKDVGHADARPVAVTVDIVRDGAVFETVTLSAENNWSYTWVDPEGSSSWAVAERDVPADYTVTVSQGDAAFVLTNTRMPPDVPDVPDTPDAPQTGYTEPLWLYVLLLVLSGLVLVVLGVGGKRGRKNDEKK